MAGLVDAEAVDSFNRNPPRRFASSLGPEARRGGGGREAPV